MVSHEYLHQAEELEELSLEDSGEGEGHLLIAGQPGVAGRYRRIDVPWGSIIELANAEPAPPSFDGTIAVCEKLPDPKEWPKVWRNWRQRLYGE